MFKIISKKKYDELCCVNKMLEKEIECLKTEHESMLNRKAKHECDSTFCSTCINSQLRRDTPMGVYEYRCKLDNSCKDYVEK